MIMSYLFFIAFLYQIVLQVRGERYLGTTNAISSSSELVDDIRNGGGGGSGVMIKPFTLQIFNDYADEWVNERGGGGGKNIIATTLPPTATAFWQTLDKHLYSSNHLPTITTNFQTIDNNNNDNNVDKQDGNALTSNEISFENLNDFGRFGTKVNHVFWPKAILQREHLPPPIYNDLQQEKQQRHSLSHIYVKDVGHKSAAAAATGKDGVGKQRPSTNIRHEISLPLFMEKFIKTKNFKPPAATTTITRATRRVKVKKSNDFTLMAANNNYDDNANDNGRGDDVNNGLVSVRQAVKENLFPLKDEHNEEESSSTSSLNVNINDEADDVDDENGIANSNGNGNESLNYADNSNLNTNYLMAAPSNNDIDREHYQQQHMQVSRLCDDKRAKPSVGHTPFLPAISGGAMTNLGKFFRDLSKNVHFSEQYQWSGQQQKLLEGDPNFSNIQHHLEKPNAATDQQTAEWIKAIRFYRPSQKIRSLVAMNPHGNWDHSSQFIDPNYMWVGLGK